MIGCGGRKLYHLLLLPGFLIIWYMLLNSNWIFGPTICHIVSKSMTVLASGPSGRACRLLHSLCGWSWLSGRCYLWDIHFELGNSFFENDYIIWDFTKKVTDEIEEGCDDGCDPADMETSTLGGFAGRAGPVVNLCSTSALSPLVSTVGILGL
jgi:hypothetical protein